ncbi:erythromycin esterase family protein [Streptomyces boncukensis]|uniref:Erythromycin esterase family protein n=1 Tax=Streptomyces boncukensis TaxID=2711219 RepID=A0A6G4X5Y1_9ACTN|nr:erythromycin esterase family protein [Streptomyces boncukensis]NGO72663.1 erythromycin esterase family protein [Streptomyces boncukensis]
MAPLARRTLLGALPLLALPATAAAATAAAAAPARAAAPAAGRPGQGADAADGAGGGAGGVVAALARAAEPLRTTSPRGPLGDLRPLGAAIGRVPVVALGEAVHGAHEMFTLKHRVFRYLVEEKGFTTFALEAGWGAGLRLDAYVRTGEGDPRDLMEQEFGGGAWPWHVAEYLDLITWMRAHNERHPRTPVRFMGNDLAHPRIDTALFDHVQRYVARHHPSLRREFGRTYGELRRYARTADLGALPQRERRRLAARARHAVRLLAPRRPSDAPDAPDAHAWAVQHARVIAQTATVFAYDLKDPEQTRRAMRYRDELMARNTAWWHRHTGHRVLLSAHNGHTAYETYDPEHYPVSQGAYLRRLLGRDYLAVGTTFGHGSEAVLDDETGDWHTETHGPPRAGSSEAVLDRVGTVLPARDYLLDMRTAPHAARAWLHGSRPTRDIGPPGDPYRPYVLGRGHDVLIHLHGFRPARPL